MEMRRRNHVQTESLRTKERMALEELATATDVMRELGEAPADGDDAAAKFSAAQQELNELGERRRVAAEARQGADEAARVAAEELARSVSAAALQSELESLGDAEAQVARSNQRWQELSDERADVQAQLNHDIKHRDALGGIGDADPAVCPTCQRPLEGTLDDLLADFKATITAREAELKRVSDQMDQAASTVKQHQAGAERAQQLRAQIGSLVGTGERANLEIAVRQTGAAAQAAGNGERELDASYRALSDQIPTLRVAAEQFVEATRRRADALERKQRATHLVRRIRRAAPAKSAPTATTRMLSRRADCRSRACAARRTSMRGAP